MNITNDGESQNERTGRVMGIERDEFQAAVAIIRDDIKGVHARLDTLNGRTRINEQNVIRIQERMKAEKKSHWPKIGGLSGILAIVGEGVRWYFAK